MQTTQGQQTSQKYSEKEYLDRETVATFRSEYRDGEILPMTGGSLNHNQIAGNVFAWLKFMLRKTETTPYIGDLRLWIPEYRQYTYPDVLLIQGQPVFQDQRTDTVLNPCLIVEVLSKSTQDYDRTDKFRYYRSISSLQEYLLIDQYARGVEQYSKTPQADWLLRTYDAAATKISLSTVDMDISLDDIYEKVIFS